jgi:hypothetical protein
MAGREVLFETFFMKAPGQDKLRKTAQGRLKTLIREGWHEMARESAGPDSVRIRFEREAATRKLPPLRRVPEPPPRRERGRGGPGGRFPGGRGGPGGPGRGAGPPGGRGRPAGTA